MNSLLRFFFKPTAAPASIVLTSSAGNPTSGVMKDVFMLGGYQEAEVDFVADNPGLTLFHCHQQLHMDFGFMALVDYV
jgi:FtsP/CotA-like multicopper oxidase with cupredoxin domain